MTPQDKLKEIKENNEIAKKADKNGDWDAYGRYCTFQDHDWLIKRIEQLEESLEWYSKGGDITFQTIKIINMDDISQLPRIIMQQATERAKKALETMP